MEFLLDAIHLLITARTQFKVAGRDSLAASCEELIAETEEEVRSAARTEAYERSIAKILEDEKVH